MNRALARFWAKRQYIWRAECKAREDELNAGVFAGRARGYRAEADAIEDNIKKVDAEDAAKEMSGKERYEAEQERKDAEAILSQKRKDADDSDKAAKYYRSQAAQARDLADRIT